MDTQQVSIKPPQFMDTNAASWFTIIEAQFHLRQITAEETKFYTVISALPPDIVTNIPYQILESKEYTKLKDSVIASYERTRPELLEKLMKTTTVTGRPSLYLQEMLAIAGRISASEEIVRHKFIRALPQQIATVIAAHTELALVDLGRLADDLMPLVQSVSAFQAVNPRSSYHNKENTIPISIRPFSAQQRPKVCRAHLYFAEAARTCKPWCKWPQKKKGNIQMLPNSRPASPNPNNSGN